MDVHAYLSDDFIIAIANSSNERNKCCIVIRRDRLVGEVIKMLFKKMKKMLESRLLGRSDVGRPDCHRKILNKCA